MKLKTLEVLTKLANQIDEIGQEKIASFIDLMIQKLADLTPVGDVFEKDGKFYRKFENTDKVLIVKEVSQDGKIIDSNVPKPTTPTDNTSSSQNQSFFEEYNPFKYIADVIENPFSAEQPAKKNDSNSMTVKTDPLPK